MNSPEVSTVTDGIDSALEKEFKKLMNNCLGPLVSFCNVFYEETMIEAINNVSERTSWYSHLGYFLKQLNYIVNYHFLEYFLCSIHYLPDCCLVAALVCSHLIV